MELYTHKGACHCNLIQFEVDTPADIVVQECNCSICSKTGYLHLIVPAAHFRLIKGEEHLSTYTFGTHEAKHLFCKNCGIKSFYIPRSNPDGYSINLRCLNQEHFGEINIEYFDGKNWEQNAHKLTHLSNI